MQQEKSIIGETRIRLPISGRIRPGLKALTKKAASNPEAKKIYDEGVEAGLTFEDIERQIEEKTSIKGALAPKNTPFFVVHRHDFVVPETADRILDLYGEDRGDGVKRLYRFPVVFIADHWLAAIPHALRCFTSSELKYWSEYAKDGRRLCKTYGEVEIDPRSKRAKRVFGGRPVVLRKENDGLCDPNDCPEYQARQCNLTGEFLFFIPGIQGAGLISLPTTSFYAMNYARGKLEMVAAMRGGRIAGLMNGKPFFEIGKRLHEISMLDPETGEPRKVSQWLIELETTLDPVSLMRPGDEHEAAALLGCAAPARGSEPAALPAQTAENATAEDAPEDVADAPTPREALAEENPANAKSGDGGFSLKDRRKLVRDLIRASGLEMDEVVAYANAIYGEGWGKDPERIERVIDELDPIAENPSLASAWREKARAVASGGGSG
ncbi:MAG: hypothetical protein DI596_03040 [Azospira oryzae]|nr:MAG: hypothetical protein DI596_03040 [Azospira oryzae]PZP81948.1 MAG: hypothetical protein DI593_03040 [Azospira oryzae]